MAAKGIVLLDASGQEGAEGGGESVAEVVLAAGCDGASDFFQQNLFGGDEVGLVGAEVGGVDAYADACGLPATDVVLVAWHVEAEAAVEGVGATCEDKCGGLLWGADVGDL